MTDLRISEERLVLCTSRPAAAARVLFAGYAAVAILLLVVLFRADRQVDRGQHSTLLAFLWSAILLIMAALGIHGALFRRTAWLDVSNRSITLETMVFGVSRLRKIRLDDLESVTQVDERTGIVSRAYAVVLRTRSSGSLEVYRSSTREPAVQIAQRIEEVLSGTTKGGDP